MKVLREYLDLADMNALERSADLLERDLSHVLAKTHNVANPVSNFPQDELNHKLGEAIKRLEAARKGLGLANKLPREKQTEHKRRIMRNLNLLRMIVQHVTHQLAKENQSDLGTEAPTDLDGQVKESLADLAAAAEENARTSSPGKRVATKSGNSAPADMDDNPFEGKARKAIRKVAAKAKAAIKK